ncbi:MAG: hypothetical protein ACRYGF_06220 [Janthinobacterium lividum]
MEQPVSTRVHPQAAPTFYLTGRQRLRPEAVLLAILVAAGTISLISYGLGKTGHARPDQSESRVSRSTKPAAADQKADDKDDPSQVDTIVLGDAADAPVPARRGERSSSVHATILVHLPRFGSQVGLIPDTPAGHLLYGWLAAFNQASPPAMGSILPGTAVASAVAAQMELRKQTGGFNLLSAREVQPGVLVFRLRDQTTFANEVLGTLQVRANSSPPAIATFSLRAVS